MRGSKVNSGADIRAKRVTSLYGHIDRIAINGGLAKHQGVIESWW